jgi:murein DD-endopeptidase MepM/ murein hydrolase activator NlpD
MFSRKRICTSLAGANAAHGMVIALTFAVGGCSADVTRFDFPSFGLTGGNQTGSLPTPSEPVARNERGYEPSPAPPSRYSGPDDSQRGRAYASPPPSGDRMASAHDLPPSSPGYAQQPPPDRNVRRIDRAPPPPAHATPARTTVAAGESIEVQQGDTLYGIAKRYGVPISALIEVNGLNGGTAIKPGQQLVLPAGVPASRIARETRPAPAVVLAPTKSTAPPASAPTALAAKPGWEGRHTVAPGESLYGIARKYNVALAELQRVNGITSPISVRMGTVLSVPARAAAPATAAAPPAAQRPQAPAAPRTAGAPPTQPRIINATEQKVASAGNTRTDAEPAAPPPPATEALSGKFRWPARGRVISAFGKRPDGTHNDGINIAVPQGTEVHAAEGGRVAYAGNELKGYGNLVLIRHDNGWVSAYAHADQILVKRDDMVRRGQVIAKAGRTGTVDQPQLHFELRQGAKPVDPMPHLDK